MQRLLVLQADLVPRLGFVRYLGWVGRSWRLGLRHVNHRNLELRRHYRLTVVVNLERLDRSAAFVASVIVAVGGNGFSTLVRETVRRDRFRELFTRSVCEAVWRNDPGRLPRSVIVVRGRNNIWGLFSLLVRTTLRRRSR